MKPEIFKMSEKPLELRKKEKIVSKGYFVWTTIFVSHPIIPRIPYNGIEKQPLLLTQEPDNSCYAA